MYSRAQSQAIYQQGRADERADLREQVQALHNKYSTAYTPSAHDAIDDVLALLEEATDA